VLGNTAQLAVLVQPKWSPCVVLHHISLYHSRGAYWAVCVTCWLLYFAVLQVAFRKLRQEWIDMGYGVASESLKPRRGLAPDM
jgi:hypothetical protein